MSKPGGGTVLARTGVVAIVAAAAGVPAAGVVAVFAACCVGATFGDELGNTSALATNVAALVPKGALARTQSVEAEDPPMLGQSGQCLKLRDCVLRYLWGLMQVV